MIGLIFLLFKRKNKKNRVGCAGLIKKSEKNYKVPPKKTIFIGRPRDDIEQFAPPDTPTTQPITPHPPNETLPRRNLQRPLPPMPHTTQELMQHLPNKTLLLKQRPLPPLPPPQKEANS